MESDKDVRAELEERYGQVWDTEQLQADFEVRSFAHYMCFVTRKSDGVKGVMDFSHSPRFYFDFTPERS